MTAAESGRWPLARVTQEHLRRIDEGGNRGDCLRACVSSILGLSPELVPHFAAIEDGRAEDDLLTHAWWWALHGFAALLTPAYDVVSIDPRSWPDPDDPDDVLGGCYLLTGPSPRGPWNHCVVARGGAVVWDPHPDGACFVGDPVAAERFVVRAVPAIAPDVAAPYRLTEVLT